MWQVSGRSDITDFEEVVRLDKEYITNWNIGLDIKILFKTILVAQTKFLSGLGIMMILFGIIIVAGSLYMYMSLNGDKVLLSVGSLSGIVVDFIGAVFIKMYTKNIEASVKFHAKFAESNNLLLANSIAHKIEDDKLREETLSEISKDIILVKKENN